MQIRVLSWNIHKGIGGADRLYRLERVVETIRSQDPDLCLLQEVSDGWPRTRYEEQAEALREALDYEHLAFGKEHRFSEGGYGNAILSRHPLHDVEHLDLTVSWRKKRGALLARAVVHQEGHQRTVAIANLHLGLAGSEREAQLERFLSCEPFRGVHQTTPVVLGGDFNDLWGSLGPRFLEKEGFFRAGKRVNTFPAYMPLRPLDGIFVRGQVEPSRAGVVRASFATAASDHLPLVADLWLG